MNGMYVISGLTRPFTVIKRSPHLGGAPDALRVGDNFAN